MKKFLLFLALLVLLAFLLSPIICYLLKFGAISLSDNKDDWNVYGQFIGGTVGPIIAILTLCVTAWIAIEFNNYQKQQNKNQDTAELQQITIELFQELRSFKIRRARDMAWEFKKMWDTATDEDKDKIILNFIAEKEETDLGIKMRHIRGLYDLFAFYTMLGLYGGNQENIKNLNYFYYAWWRKFLYEVATKYDKHKITNITTNPVLDDAEKFNKADFYNNISLERPLKKMDELCGFSKLDTTLDLYILNN